MTFRRLRKNEPFRNTELNALAKIAESVEDMFTRDETWLASRSMDCRLARIVGADAISGGGERMYEFRFLDYDDANIATDSADGVWGGRDGYWPAYEASGNKHVPLDGSVIVEMRPGDGGPYFIFDYHEPRLIAKITGFSASGFAHSWEEQTPQPSYPSNHSLDGAIWGTMPSGRTGTTTSEPAFERCGAVNIPADTIVELYRAYSSGKARVTIDPLFQGDGDTLSPQQNVTIDDAVAGTFTLTFDNTADGSNPQTTAAISYSINAAGLKAALEALSNITTVTVTGSGTFASPFVVQFDDTVNPTLPLVANTASLLGDQWWEFYWPQNIQDLNIKNLTVTDTMLFDSVIVTINSSTFNFNTSLVNITNNSYFTVGGDTTVIISDPIFWGRPKVVDLVTNVCLYTKTLNGILNTQTEIPNATWVDLVTLTFTVEKPTTFIAWGVLALDCNSAGVAATNHYGALHVDGADEATLIKFRTQHTDDSGQPSQCWSFVLAAGSHTLILRAKRFDGTGTIFATIDTTLTIHADDVLTVEKSTMVLPNGSYRKAIACLDNPVDCCASTSSGGTGSGGGGGGLKITTLCCDHDICETLAATVSGTCGGVATLAYDAGLAQPAWVGSVETVTGKFLDLSVFCRWNGSAWVWVVAMSGCYAGTFEGAGLAISNCDPLLSLETPPFSFSENCCGDGVSSTITVNIDESADCVSPDPSGSCCGGAASMPGTLYGYVTGLDVACPDEAANLHNLVMLGATDPSGYWSYGIGTLICTAFNMNFLMTCLIPPGGTSSEWVMEIAGDLDGSGDGLAWTAISTDAVCDHPEFGGFYATFNNFVKNFTGIACPYPVSIIVRRDTW